MPKKEPKPKENPKLVIPFSESDLQDLINGEEFRWTFTTDKGQDIDVLLRPESEDDFGEADEDMLQEDLARDTDEALSSE